jgi:hypothetical protein
MSEPQRSQRSLVLALCAALFLIGCSRFGSGSQVASGALQVNGANSDGGEFILTVVDTAHLVTDGQSLPRPGDLPDRGVTVDADGRGILVWWPGQPCEDHPVITVRAAYDAIAVQVDNGPLREACVR